MEASSVSPKLFLDTCACLYLHEGLEHKFSNPAKEIIETHTLYFSPMVSLELKYLEVSKKITSYETVLHFLRKTMLAAESEVPFGEVIAQSIEEDWTRDPFDRIIVAHARLEQAHLLTSDKNISDSYDLAII